LAAKPHLPAYGTDGDYFSKPSAEDIYDGNNARGETSTILNMDLYFEEQLLAALFILRKKALR